MLLSRCFALVGSRSALCRRGPAAEPDEAADVVGQVDQADFHPRRVCAVRRQAHGVSPAGEGAAGAASACADDAAAGAAGFGGMTQLFYLTQVRFHGQA